MSPFALLLTELTAELALFAAAGFLLFAIDDLIVDFIYFFRIGWRALAIYSRFPRSFADTLPSPMRPGWLARAAWRTAAISVGWWP